MQKKIRIGTRESQLAVWQAEYVKKALEQSGHPAELHFIKTDGDIDLKTPLYEMGVQGIFTKSLDIALLNDQVDIAVHSMKDVPTRLAKDIVTAAVLKRGSYKDLLVFRDNPDFLKNIDSPSVIATSSIRRKAQWLNRYPNHHIENLRGNVNTRLKKLQDSNWNGAIFAAAGLERIALRPPNSVELDWMLPAPAQGAIMIVCKDGDLAILKACETLNHKETATCTRIERDFLRTLLGGCSTPISALAEIKSNTLFFKGNILSADGKEKMEIELSADIHEKSDLGTDAALELLSKGANRIIRNFRNANGAD